MLRVLPHKRTKWDGFGLSNCGHIKSGKDRLLDLGIDFENNDKTNMLNLTRKFTVNTESFQSGFPNSDSVVTCYTDGSQIKDGEILGNAGFGYGIVQDKNVISSNNGQLSDKNTVFTFNGKEKKNVGA